MRLAHDADVLVVGAGPAGTAAGITARARGLEVLVVDKAVFPRDKTCGDGLTTSALRLLERVGLDVRALPSYTRVRDVVVAGPEGRELRLPLPWDGEHAGVVPRLELDQALVELARARGVAVCDGLGLARVSTDAAGVTATFDDGTTRRARFVVAADGHYSSVRRCLRPSSKPELGTWHAVRQYFRGVDDPRLWVLFERDLLPGYAWVFPLAGGRANVGFGVLRRSGLDGKALKALWRDLLTRESLRRVLGSSAEPEAPHRAWPIPGAHRGSALGDGRVLYVGDAAGVVDPLTGEGIAQALETGMLAADTIATGVAGGPVDVAGSYRRRVRGALGRDLRFAGMLQRVLASPSGASLALSVTGLNGWTRRNFARWMFEDYPRAMLLTPGRWHRGMLTAAGAYAGAA